MKSALKQHETPRYQALTAETVAHYLDGFTHLAARLGGKPSAWNIREVGDGNLNLVFIVKGETGDLCVKQALPYVRMVGESWPLPLSRSYFEHEALKTQALYAPKYVPALYHHEREMALFVMEYLSPHIILRKGLTRGIEYPDAARHLAEFLAITLYRTSDFNLTADRKKQQIALFAGNTAMCKITEDLIFDEPYFAAPMNRHTAGLDDIARAFQEDERLKNAAQDLKWRFMTNAESLLHGDIHTGSVMVTEKDTRAIDPEFAFYGPIGFDVGSLIANFILAYFAQAGREKTGTDRHAFASWIGGQIPILWNVFAATFAKLAESRNEKNQGGDIYAPRMNLSGNPGVKQHLDRIWKDTLGFAGLEIIRRILGLAHVEDMESIADLTVRASCERRALQFARSLLLEGGHYRSIESLARALMS